MSSFSADWLALREPVDEVSRTAALTQKLVEAMPAQDGRRIGTDGHEAGDAKIELATGKRHVSRVGSDDIDDQDRGDLGCVTAHHMRSTRMARSPSNPFGITRMSRNRTP